MPATVHVFERPATARGPRLAGRPDDLALEAVAILEVLSDELRELAINLLRELRDCSPECPSKLSS